MLFEKDQQNSKENNEDTIVMSEPIENAEKILQNWVEKKNAKDDKTEKEIAKRQLQIEKMLQERKNKK